MKKELFIIIRSVGERTTNLAAKMAEQIPGVSVIVHDEVMPFPEKLQHTMQCAALSGAEWSLMIDADVLLVPGAVERLMTHAANSHKLVFCLQGLVVDKFLPTQAGAREAGVHMYRNKYLRTALALFNGEQELAIRPETNIRQIMARKGFPTVIIPKVVGVHDFWQYYRDIYRKNFIQAHKHRGRGLMLMPYWERWADFDQDYHIAKVAFEAGLSYFGEVIILMDNIYEEGAEKAVQAAKISEKRAIYQSEYPKLKERVAELYTMAEWMDMNLKKFKNR